MDLNRLQFRQELHDQYFHDDIYKLGRHRRLEHLTLHHVKYSAQLMETIYLLDLANNSEEAVNARSRDWDATVAFIYRRCLDGLLVSLSMFNTMNIRAEECWERDDTWSLQRCVREGVYATGRLAKMIEDIDHFVIDKVADTLRKEVGMLVKVYKHLLYSIGSFFNIEEDFEATVVQEVWNRMMRLEEGKFMADHFHAQIDQQMKERDARVLSKATQ